MTSISSSSSEDRSSEESGSSRWVSLLEPLSESLRSLQLQLVDQKDKHAPARATSDCGTLAYWNALLPHRARDNKDPHDYYSFLHETEDEEAPTHISLGDLVDGLLSDGVAVFQVHGGRFAGAVWRGEEVVRRKTLKHYTVRRKQGGRQATYKKSNKNAGRSAGGQLRVAEEKKHADGIRHVLSKWKEELERVRLILIHAPGLNYDYFFEDALLEKEDPRIRRIPFTTHRPKHSELEKTYRRIMRIEMLEEK